MSLKKIAELSGTSIATVSRVLNLPEYHCKDAELEERIWTHAREMGYVPNRAAQNLKRGSAAENQSRSVDVFFARDFQLDNDSFFQELYEFLREELLAQHCHIGELYGLPDVTLQMQNTRPEFRIGDTSDGIIILGKSSSEISQYFQKKYPAVVGIDRNPTDFEYDEIFCNGKTAATMAMEHLFSLGHTKVGYIGDCSFEARYIGYYQSLTTHKIPFDYDKILPAIQTREGGFQAMSRYLEQHKQLKRLPTAFFCANDCTALGVLDALKKVRGYQPAVISIDNIRESAESSPMLTTISLPIREMAHLAVWVLLDRMNGKHTQNIRMELPCHLIVRESTSGNVY